MPHIILTEEQRRAVAGASEPVEVRDPRGQVFAFFRPLDREEIESLRLFEPRRASPSPAPAIPAARVQATLRKLEEIDRQEGATPEKVEGVLRRLRAGEEL
jgi:hypothetical protein